MSADTPSASTAQPDAPAAINPAGHQLVVVANRLPVDARTLPDGATEWGTTPGGRGGATGAGGGPGGGGG